MILNQGRVTHLPGAAVRHGPAPTAGHRITAITEEGTTRWTRQEAPTHATGRLDWSERCRAPRRPDPAPAGPPAGRGAGRPRPRRRRPLVHPPRPTRGAARKATAARRQPGRDAPTASPAAERWPGVNSPTPNPRSGLGTVESGHAHSRKRDMVRFASRPPTDPPPTTGPNPATSGPLARIPAAPVRRRVPRHGVVPVPRARGLARALPPPVGPYRPAPAPRAGGTAVSRPGRPPRPWSAVRRPAGRPRRVRAAGRPGTRSAARAGAPRRSCAAGPPRCRPAPRNPVPAPGR